MVHNIIYLFTDGKWGEGLAEGFCDQLNKSRSQLRFTVLRFAILKTACGYNKGHFKRQAAFLQLRCWLMLKKPPFLAQSQERLQWGDLITVYARNPAFLWLHSMLKKKSKISNYKAATRTGLWEDFASLQLLTITSTSPVSAPKTGLQVLHWRETVFTNTKPNIFKTTFQE